MNTSSRLISTLCLASLGIASLLAPSVFAAPPPVTVTQPVQVQVVNTAAQPAQVEVVKPVNVQGSVETLDDALHQPYAKSGNVFLKGVSDGVQGEFSGTLSFAVPAGKRLVIETISVRFIVPSGQAGVADLYLSSAEHLALAMQPSMPWGNYSLYTSTLPVRVRVDAPANANGTFSITMERTSNVATANFFAGVAGYLVDL